MTSAITPLPSAPSRGDANFAATADTFLAALPGLATEINTVVGEVNDQTAEIYSLYAEVLAQTGASTARGTSTSSVAIGTGAKSFTTQAGKAFKVGQPVIVSSAANRANWMFGVVGAYASTTLDLTVSSVGGSGTHADWDVLIASPPGQVLVTDFTASGTWTKSPTARQVIVMVLGAGGGGAGASHTDTVGKGGGGGGGAYAVSTFAAADLPGTVAVVVGAGGAGGAAGLNPGAAGGYSEFGDHLRAYGGGGGGAGAGTTSGGGGGGGGQFTVGAVGVVGTGATNGGAGGAGGGGMPNNAGVPAVGADGGAGSSTSAAGGAGVAGEAKPYGGGGGGGGSSSSTAANAAPGGNAAFGGAGGGGGGTAQSGGYYGGFGGLSIWGGHGGAGAGRNVTTPVNSIAQTAGWRNPLVGLGGGSIANADGTAGGVGCGGGAACGTGGVTNRAGGAGGRGHVRIIEI